MYMRWWLGGWLGGSRLDAQCIECSNFFAAPLHADTDCRSSHGGAADQNLRARDTTSGALDLLNRKHSLDLYVSLSVSRARFFFELTSTPLAHSAASTTPGHTSNLSGNFSEMIIFGRLLVHSPLWSVSRSSNIFAASSPNCAAHNSRVSCRHDPCNQTGRAAGAGGSRSRSDV